MKKAEVYLPFSARSHEQLGARYDLLRLAREEGFATGLMLVIGADDLSPESQRQQIDNLNPFAQLPQTQRPMVFGMHPNMPLEGESRLNFLDNAQRSHEYIEQGIEFVANLPDELAPKTGKALSFHLNTLMKPGEWKPDPEFWQKAFEDIVRRMRDISAFGKRNEVAVAIETVPIPEYGDVSQSAKSLMKDGQTYWRDLGNPWPLLFWRDEIRQLRQAGTQIAIDFCHSHIALQTVRQIAKLPKEDRQNAMQQNMLYEKDLEMAKSVGSLSQQILAHTQEGDIWHVNDGRVNRSRKSLANSSPSKLPFFDEGIALFEGSIPKRGLKRLIQGGSQLAIKFVIEVNESDFQESPNTRRSLERVIRLALVCE